MIILNTTFHVHESVADSFKAWVRLTYFPQAANESNLLNPVFTRLLIEVHEGYESFAVQLMAPTIDDAVNWHDGKAAELRAILNNKYGEKVLFFTTYMELLPID